MGKIGFQTDGLEKLISRLELIQDKLENPGPAVQGIVVLFSIMEAQRFAQGGMAPEFGITSKWAPWASTTAPPKPGRRGYDDAGSGANVLVGLGFLRAAAISPRYTPLTSVSNTVTLSIDPRDKGYRRPKGNANYAAVQQEGNTETGMPARPIVTITPVFLELAKEIVRNYILGYEVDPNKAPEAPKPEDVNYRSRRGAGWSGREDTKYGASPEDYATFQNRINHGVRLDHSTTESIRLQKEYNDVLEARRSGDLSAFRGNKSFYDANRRVGRYLSSAKFSQHLSLTHRSRIDSF